MKISKDKNEMEEYSVPPEMNPATSQVCIRADKGNDLVLSFVSGLQFCYVYVFAQRARLSLSSYLALSLKDFTQIVLYIYQIAVTWNFGICSEVGELIQFVAMWNITEPTIHQAERGYGKYSTNGS